MAKTPTKKKHKAITNYSPTQHYLYDAWSALKFVAVCVVSVIGSMAGAIAFLWLLSAFIDMTWHLMTLMPGL